MLEQNLKVAAGFSPITCEQLQALRDRCRTHASDGRFELFKTTKKYDGNIGREQHHLPLQHELPA